MGTICSYVQFKTLRSVYVQVMKLWSLKLAWQLSILWIAARTIIWRAIAFQSSTAVTCRYLIHELHDHSEMLS